MAFDLASAVPVDSVVEPAHLIGHRRFDLDSAEPVQEEGTPAPFTSRFHQTVFPTTGAMGGGAAALALLNLLAPEAGIPATIAAASAGGAGGTGLMEWLRQHLSGQPIQPRRIAGEMAGAAAFAPLAESAGAGIGLLAPQAARFLPVGKSLLMPGSVLNTGARAALASGAIGAGEGAATPPADVPDTLMNRLKQSGLEALKSLGPGFVFGSGFRAFGPPQLGGGRFYEAVGGNQARVAAVKQAAVQEVAGEENLAQGAFADESRAAETQLESSVKALQHARQSLAQQQAILDSQTDMVSTRISRQSNRQVLAVQQDLPRVRVQQQTTAWEPARQLAAENTHRYTEQEITDAVDVVHGQEPGRAIAAKRNLLDSVRAIGESRRLTERRTGTMSEGGIAIPKFTPGGAKLSLSERLSIEKALSELTLSQRADAVKQLGEPTQATTYSAQDLMDASTRIGMKGSKSVKSGKSAPTAEDLPHIDARTVVVKLLDDYAPSGSKGKFAAAKQQWSDFLRDDAMHRKLFAGGRFTDAGSKFFRDAAIEKLSPSGRGYLQRLTKSLGYDPVQRLTPFVSRSRSIEARHEEITARLSAITDQEQQLVKAHQDYVNAKHAELKGRVAGAKRQATDRAIPALQALRRQSTIARRLAYMLSFPLTYALIRQPIYQALRKQ